MDIRAKTSFAVLLVTLFVRIMIKTHYGENPVNKHLQVSAYVLKLANNKLSNHQTQMGFPL